MDPQGRNEISDLELIHHIFDRVLQLVPDKYNQYLDYDGNHIFINLTDDTYVNRCHVVGLNECGAFYLYLPHLQFNSTRNFGGYMGSIKVSDPESFQKAAEHVVKAIDLAEG